MPESEYEGGDPTHPAIPLIADDDRLFAFLHNVMVLGEPPSFESLSEEFQLAAQIAAEYGVDIDTFSLAADICRANIDRAIFNGEIGLK